MGIGNAVDDAGDPNRVIRPLPTLAAQRDPCLDRAELPHYGPEQIIETYYSYAVSSATKLSLDYQFITNPGYSKDRGPANVFAVRFHAQF